MKIFSALNRYFYNGIVFKMYSQISMKERKCDLWTNPVSMPVTLLII